MWHSLNVVSNSALNQVEHINITANYRVIITLKERHLSYWYQNYWRLSTGIMNSPNYDESSSFETQPPKPVQAFSLSPVQHSVDKEASYSLNHYQSISRNSANNNKDQKTPKSHTSLLFEHWISLKSEVQYLQKIF